MTKKKHPIIEWREKYNLSRAAFVEHVKKLVGRNMATSTLQNVEKGHEPGLCLALDIVQATYKEVSVYDLADAVKSKKTKRK